MTIRELPLQHQTIYAELLDRCQAAAFEEAFPEQGTFTAKTVKGRRYWYFQQFANGEKRQRYVGPESPDLLARIGRHRTRRDDARERRALVATLVRAVRVPAPPARIGAVIAALAQAGVFRLRGVLVGTLAFQCYGIMLGVRLPLAAAQTEDIDIAQFREVSVATGDRIANLLETMRAVDPSLRKVPHRQDPLVATAFANAGGALRVEFLAPNRGPDSDKPRALPALGVHGQPLRFLDFLIRDAVPAVVLHGPGIPVLVPSPERFAVHKLIVSRRRSSASAKWRKDQEQAEALLNVLALQRPEDLQAVWHEAWQRGATWRKLLGEALARIDPAVGNQVRRLTGIEHDK